MTLAIGPCVEYLVVQAEAAVVGVNVNGHPVTVSDGPYRTAADGMFVIGLAEPVAAGGPARPVTVQRNAITFGLPMNLSEQIDIPCFIDFRQPGTQKQVRDAAETAFNAFNNRLLTDPSAGGLISGGMAFVTAVEASPQLVGTVAEPGRRYFISFTVRCTDITT